MLPWKDLGHLIIPLCTRQNARFPHHKRSPVPWPGHLLVQQGPIVGGEDVLSLIAWVQHPNAHQALDDELRLEEILAVLCKSLWGEGGPVRRPQPSPTVPHPYAQPCKKA